MNIFDPRNETMPREELEQFQLERLQALMARLRRTVPRYKELIAHEQVQTLSDLHNLPPTSPTDLAAAFPYGMFALPLREVIRLHSAMGPDGMQLVVGHTRNDLTHWTRLTARQLVAVGGTAHDVVQIGFGAGTVAQTLGYMLGAEFIEASVIPQDAYHTEYQLAMMQSYRANVLVTTPTEARELAAVLDARGIDPKSLQLRTLLLSRPVPPAEKEELEAGLLADVRCNFGVPEVLDPGFCVECPEGRFHANEDHFLVETADGELLVTTLTREAMPLLRYRTRIRCEIEHLQCSCGRTGAVLRPAERLDGQLRVNEMPLYRNQIEALLALTRAAGEPFLLDISDDRVTVSIKVTSRLFPDTIRELENLKSEIRSEFFTRLGIRAEVAFLAPREFEARAKAVG
jgi:phenylacetate-CoA ligase